MAPRTASNPYGNYGKHVELFRLFESWRDDPKVNEALVQEGMLQEASGVGAPEGRADFALYLLTITRHQIRQGFKRRESVWERYMGVERAEDFRQHTSSELGSITGIGPVPEFDEYGRMKSSEFPGPSFSVGKHGGIYGITYETVINDQPGELLNRIPTEMGRASSAYVSQSIAALIEANGNWSDGLPFFTATAREGLPLGNEVTGSGAEPSEDNLISMVAAIRGTVDREGFPIDIEPGSVLTKDERVAAAFRRILRSQETGTTTGTQTSATTADKGTYNAAQGLLGDDPVIIEPYLKDPNDWILFAKTNPGRAAFIIAFLRDQRVPTILLLNPGWAGANGGSKDPYTTDFDEILFKLRHVFGVAQGDPRAARRARRA